MRAARVSALPWPNGTRRTVASALAVLCLSEFVRTGLYASFLYAYGPRHGMSLSLVALAWTVHFGADTVGRALGGRLVTQYGLDRVAFAGGLLGLLAVWLVPQVPVPWMVLVLAALHGLGFSALWPGTLSTASLRAQAGEQARAVGFATMAVAPFTGVAFLTLAPLTKLQMHGGLPIAWLTLMVMQGLATLAALGAPRHLVVEAPPAPDAALQAPPRVRRTLLFLLPAAVVQTLALTLVGPLLQSDGFKHDSGLSTLGVWGLPALLAVGGAAAYGLLNFTGRLADRRDPRLVLIVGLVLAGAGMTALALKPPVWAYFAIAALVGVGYAGLVPGWGGLLTRMLPERDRATAWGAVLSAENIGTGVGPLLGAVAYDQFGLSGPFVVASVLLFGVALMYVLSRFRTATSTA
ncbi:MFS transporter [Deinococcus maricopensis]|uniref:Major facilitator superfamily MFS_1 n=1 Tax=Deinococcus maricopensis (strain DSM 21211 / LMG 22137 / NRRL B-23946 / LB-34) TaxID=709986 RepID=E8U5B2_DEIML|nr:MFS transporter [Deinococcus maricopensis]ADV66251.1 major facilitator superfamily MFS_1 [Deinococcus maricopensis DSM 21211]